MKHQYDSTGNLITLSLIIIFSVSFSLCIYGGYKSIYLGTKSKDYKIVCIDGHEYYRANFMTKGFLAIRLGDFGAPVECDGGCEDYQLNNAKILEPNPETMKRRM